MKTAMCTCVLSLLVAVMVTAAPNLLVAYLEGSAYLQKGSSWEAISIGDAIPVTSNVRLDAGGSLKLSGIGTDISLTQQGTYLMQDLLSVRQAMGSSGVDMVLAKVLEFLLQGTLHNQSTAAGVRGANESKSEDSEWVESGTQDTLQQAKDFIQAENYSKAIEVLSQSLDTASQEELPTIHHCLAYALSLTGNTTAAIKELAGIRPKDNDSWAPDFVLLKAKLYLDSFTFSQAVVWLTQSGNDLSGDAQRAPLYYFFLGIGYRGMGDTANEKGCLAKVEALSEGNYLGKVAEQLLQGP